MDYIKIPETRHLSDLEKFVEGLKQLASICNVTSISGIAVYFGDGTKNSLKGLIRVEKGQVIGGPSYIAYDMQSEEEEKQGCLETVFKDGHLLKDYTLEEIRERVDSTL